MIKKAIFEITVTPKSSRSMIKVENGENIRVYLNSPPVDGKANSECITLLSKKLRTAKSNITIEKGDHGRKKRISVSGMEYQDVLSKLEE